MQPLYAGWFGLVQETKNGLKKFLVEARHALKVPEFQFLNYDLRF